MKRFRFEIAALSMATYYVFLFHKEPQFLALMFGLLGAAYFIGKLLQIDPKTKIPAFRIVFIGQPVDGKGHNYPYHAGFKEHIRNCFSFQRVVQSRSTNPVSNSLVLGSEILPQPEIGTAEADPNQLPTAGLSDSPQIEQNKISSNFPQKPSPFLGEPTAEPVEPCETDMQLRVKQDTGTKGKEPFGWAYDPVEILAFFAFFEGLGHLEIPDRQAFLDSPSILTFEKRIRWSSTKSRLAFFAKELQSQGFLTDKPYGYWPFICHLFVFKDREGRLERLDPKSISNNATRENGLSEQDREQLRIEIQQAKLSVLKSKR